MLKKPNLSDEEINILREKLYESEIVVSLEHFSFYEKRREILMWLYHNVGGKVLKVEYKDMYGDPEQFLVLGNGWILNDEYVEDWPGWNTYIKFLDKEKATIFAVKYAMDKI